MEVYVSEPLVPEPSHFEVQTDIANIKRYKSPGIIQIPAELIRAGTEIYVMLVSADDVNLLDDNINTIKKNTQILIDASNENYWIFGLFPLSRILGNRKHDVSETGSVSIFR
jgi:hypothetical protein